MSSQQTVLNYHRGFSRFGPLIIALLFLGGMTFIFGWLLDRQYNPNQSRITRISSAGATEVTLKRNRAGHYLATGKVNEETVVFLLDTGATDVVVPAGLARRLHLTRGETNLAQTANGTVQVFDTRIESVALGGIELNNVEASINPGMTGSEILLGMSFLRHLELIQRGDELRIRVPAN